MFCKKRYLFLIICLLFANNNASLAIAQYNKSKNKSDIKKIKLNNSKKKVKKKTNKKKNLYRKKNNKKQQFSLIEKKNVIELYEIKRKNKKLNDVNNQYKITFNKKNKGVPKLCIVNNDNNSSKENDEKNIYNSSLLEEKKQNLKNHIVSLLKRENVSKNLIEKIYSFLEIIPSVRVKDDNFNKTLDEELIKRYDIEQKIKDGEVYIDKYSKQLSKISNVFNIEPEILMSIWGVETNYNRVIGDYNILKALYSSAMNSISIDRVDFFENNLVMFSKLIDNGYFDFNLTGSYAGAIGGCQFMPENVYKLAVSYSNRKPDIVNNHFDILSSIGNYLHKNGWKFGEGVLTEIELPEDINICLFGLGTSKSIHEWIKLGVKLHSSGIGQNNVKNLDKMASVIVLDVDHDGKALSKKRAFFVYDNYRVILSYNQAIKYGIASGLIYEDLISKKLI